MISLSTPHYDLLGQLWLKPQPGSGRITYQRRTSKAATLDGLSSISDFGYTASDNTLTIKLNQPSPAQLDRLVYLVQWYPLLHLANADGLFLGALSQVRADLSPPEFIFDIKEQVA